MKQLLILTGAVLFSLSSFAADNWTTYYNNNLISIQYKKADCHDEHNGIHQQKLWLRFSNESDSSIALTFSKKLTYTNRPATTTDVTYKVLLAPHETKEGDCNTKDNSLYIFSKQLNIQGSELKSFDLKNIEVKIIE